MDCTLNLYPSASKTSPISGSESQRSKIQPAMVSYSSLSSMGQPSSMASSQEKRPSTSHSLLERRVRYLLSGSNSSSISPTISSTMSSMVMMPAVPPYSSTTTTIWSWAVCISESKGRMSFVSGMNVASRMKSLTGRSAPSPMAGAIRSLMCAIPTTLSWSS